MISVIVPNYNHAPYLEQRLDGILAQTFQDFEIIILDDCSPDNSKEIIEKYRTCPKVTHIVYNETNSGSVFQQWKRGIALAQGELIWLAESDDDCEPTFLAEMAGHFQKNEGLAMAFVQSILFNENKIIGKTTAEFFEEQLEGKEFLGKYMLSTNTMINASAVLFRKQAFGLISDEYTRYKQCGDWRFWCEMAEHGNVLISGKYLNYYRSHSLNASSEYWKKGLFFLEGSEIIKYLIEKHGFTDSVISEQVGKMMMTLEYEREFRDKDLYEKLLKQMININPKLIEPIQAAVVRRRQKEKIKNIIKRTLSK